MSELPRWHASAAPAGVAGRERAETARATTFASVPTQAAAPVAPAPPAHAPSPAVAPSPAAAPTRRPAAGTSTAAAEEFERPSSARVYDYLLGGAAHGAVDRELGERLKRSQPGIVDLARENRAFLRRAVRFLLATGVEQFLDLGSGVPTMGNVHEVVARSRSGARVAYTDVDSIAALHGQHLLAALPTATYTAVDVRDVDAVLSSPGVAGLLDLRRPVGLLAFSVFQHVRDDAAGLVGDYLDRLAPGSALALSHFTDDDPRTGPTIAAEATAYPRAVPRARSRADVAALVADVDLVDPGLVWADEWRPEPGRPAGAATLRGHWAAVGFRR
ncbi:SAM-dependent methyltransferase [Actinomycetospora endophytica]|uniref:SAM-dependent methyltransferase n=1 Tax=Actinomycetospora endophytica TaxID=2291215 RepID=A0ABS8P8K8_9PSEU|nr:SAM-dependent methyltransferase [Actinomycetospora endophytica]MCD2193850.1 SAM-dependent methyltransferase [Actinomycetospora endophytica]